MPKRRRVRRWGAVDPGFEVSASGIRRSITGQLPLGRHCREGQPGKKANCLPKPDDFFVILSTLFRIILQMSIQARVLNWRIPFTFSASEADWEALYAEELPRIYNFFRYRVGDTTVAEDLTSITFEKAWRCRQQYRREEFEADLSLDDISHPLDGNTPEDSAIRRSEVERLSALMGGLPGRERELLALRYGSELATSTIAQITGLSESNVRTILHRTLHKLRARW